jgi:DNA-directed RNA polymerase subunit RPC12/RpoP
VRQAITFDMSEKIQNVVCPKCGSLEIGKPRFSKRAMAISILLIGFPLPFINKECHCFDCGSDFKFEKKNMR